MAEHAKHNAISLTYLIMATWRGPSKLLWPTGCQQFPPLDHQLAAFLSQLSMLFHLFTCFIHFPKCSPNQLFIWIWSQHLRTTQYLQCVFSYSHLGFDSARSKPDLSILGAEFFIPCCPRQSPGLHIAALINPSKKQPGFLDSNYSYEAWQKGGVVVAGTVVKLGWVAGVAIWPLYITISPLYPQ